MLGLGLDGLDFGQCHERRDKRKVLKLAQVEDNGVVIHILRFTFDLRILKIKK